VSVAHFIDGLSVFERFLTVSLGCRFEGEPSIN
jgi:hypothetical protein